MVDNDGNCDTLQKFTEQSYENTSAHLGLRGVYSHRIVSGDRDHRYFSGFVAARPREGQIESAAHQMRKQP
jgi:hypothetical protein